MIAELILISELLRGYSGSTPPPSKDGTTKTTRAKTHTPGSKASLAGFLKFGGPITKIVMPVDLSSYDPQQAASDYMAAVEQYSTEKETIAQKLARNGGL